MEQKAITRADLTAAVGKSIGLSGTESARLVSDVLDEMINALANEGTVKLSSFGTFATRDKSERIGRNPKTKEEAVIKARRVVTFHPSSSLRKLVNK